MPMSHVRKKVVFLLLFVAIYKQLSETNQMFIIRHYKKWLHVSLKGFLSPPVHPKHSLVPGQMFR